MGFLEEATAFLGVFDFQGMSDIDKVNAIAAISQTVAALLSLSALILSLWVFSRQQHISRWQLRLQREDHIIGWARSTLALMAEVEEHVYSHVSLSDELLSANEFLQYRSRLSALIDEGRLYFPNLDDTSKGAGKAKAYRGHRQAILDPLVAFYERLLNMEKNPQGATHSDASIELNRLRRSFVSSTQTEIDPRRFNRVRA